MVVVVCFFFVFFLIVRLAGVNFLGLAKLGERQRRRVFTEDRCASVAEHLANAAKRFWRTLRKVVANVAERSANVDEGCGGEGVGVRTE